MEQESARIERHIESTRENLGRNLDEIESRVRSKFDWRQQYDRNPWMVLGVAFGVGAAAASMMGRPRGGSYSSSSSYSSYSSNRSSYSGTPSKVSRAWSKMQTALLAAATQKAEQFLDELVPGFREEYRSHSDVVQ